MLTGNASLRHLSALAHAMGAKRHPFTLTYSPAPGGSDSGAEGGAGGGPGKVERIIGAL